MAEWSSEMHREMEQLKQILDGLGDAIDSRLTGLKTEIGREFTEQKRLSLEQARFNEQQARINQEHHQSISRMSASFDQTLTEMNTDLLRRIRSGSVIWSALTQRTAEMQLDIERNESLTDNLRQRVDAIEKRLAG